MRLAHFGTFDIENFGDLLFPLVLRRRLGDVAEDVVFASPLGGPAVWDGAPPTVPVDELLEPGVQVDGVLLGGGNVVHAQPWNAESYGAGGASGLLAYPKLWLGAAVLACRAGAPLAWNAPGVPREFPDVVRPVVRWAVETADLLAVRDRASAERLTAAVPGARVAIVPDTALEVSRLWSAREVDDAFRDAFAARGREVADRTLAVHLNARYLDEPAPAIAARLDRLAETTGATVVLLGLGPLHGDDALAREAGERMASAPLVVERPRSLLEAAALIGRSVAYAGSSMHGLITALSFGVPAVSVVDETRTGLRKFSGLLEQVRLTDVLVPGWAVAAERVPELLGEPTDRFRRVLPAVQPALDAHWSRIATLLEGGRDASRPRPGEEVLWRVARGVLPGAAPLLAGVSQHYAGDAARAKQRAEASQQARVARDRAAAALEQQLAAHGERAAALEREVADARTASAARVAELDAAREALRAAEGELARAREDAGRLGDALRGAREGFGDALAAVREQLQAERDRVLAERADAEREREAADRLRRGTAELDAALAAAREELRRLRTERADALAQRDAELAERDAALAERDAGLAERDAEVARLRDEAARLQAHADRLEAAAARNEAEQRAARERLQGRADAERRRTEAARAELRALREEADAAQADLERQVAEAAAAGRRSAADREAIASLQRAAAATRKEIERVAASRSWRWGHGLARRARRWTFRPPVRGVGGVEVALSRVRDLERSLEELAEKPAPAPPAAPVARPRRARPVPGAGPRRPTVSVVCWDMGHNPLTRGNLLADVLHDSCEVEITGALFERYGGTIWPPLQDHHLTMRTFPGSDDARQHFRRMEEFAQTLTGDVVYVSKPRMPSYGLGMLAKEARNRPLLLDSDDRELSFFGLTTGIGFDELQARREEPDFLVPYGGLWTQYMDSLIHDSDWLSVSNVALARAYGGEVIPHVRDERVFDPALHPRDDIRARFGFEPDDRVVLFAGTPRAHKGIQGIASALREIGDRRNKLLVIGTVTDKYLREQLETFGDWIRLIPYQPFKDMPRILRLADLICVLQDPDSEISQYQIPAKVTDALAMEIPCLTTRVPPLEPLFSIGAIETIEGDDLEGKLRAMLGDLDAFKRRSADHREVFLEEYSYAAVRPVMEEAIHRLVDDPPPFPEAFARTLDLQRSAFGTGTKAPASGGAVRIARPEGRDREASSNGAAGNGVPAPADEPGRARPRRARLGRRGEPFDLVMFWKQNDTGIYGRRQDMLVKYLAQSDRVRQIVHFDHPIDPVALRENLARGDAAHQGNLVVRNTVARVAGRRHAPKVARYTFLHRPEGATGRGAALPALSEYPDYVAAKLLRHGVGERPTVFWVYPRNFEFPALREALDPDFVVADIMDDHRTWVDPSSRYHAKLTQNYRDILVPSDLVLTNADTVARIMREFREDIAVVPNACEPPPDRTGPVRRPRELARLKGPIVGYVGNLSARIDIPLLDLLATTRPQWNLVLIGSTHLNRDVLELDRHPNVHFLGVRPYEEVRELVPCFDVALIPHLDNEMTRAMNPLKAFVYAAAGVPVVSTPVANLSEVGELLEVASTHEEFRDRVEAAIRRGRPDRLPPAQLELLRRHSWPVRVERVLQLIDDGAGR